MNYFKDCQTLAEAKTVYRKLCMKFHPDKGGNAKDFIQLLKQFKNFVPRKKTESDASFNYEKFHNLVMKFEHLDGLKVSFVGTFIWIEGNTYPQKDKIKAINLDGYNSARFAKRKKCWYFSPQGYKKTSRKNMKLEQIKTVFGSETYQTKSQKYLT